MDAKDKELQAEIEKLIESRVESFKYENKEIGEFPSSFADLTFLTSLHLANTKIGTWSMDLFKLVSLEHLDLRNTGIDALGGEIKKLTKLKHLDISENAIQDIPHQLGSLPLRTLKVDSNDLVRLPSTLGRIWTLGSEGGEFTCQSNPLDVPFKSFIDRPYAMLAYLRGILPLDDELIPRYFDHMISVCEGSLTISESEEISDFLEHHNPEEIAKFTREVVLAMTRNSAPRFLIPAQDFAKLLTNLGFLSSLAQQIEEFIQEITTPRKTGWLVKRGGRHKSWKKRFFILQYGYLFYFKNPKDYEPKGSIPLFDVDEASVDMSKENKKCGFKLVTEWRTYRIYASDEEIRDEWIAVVNDAVKDIALARKTAEFLRVSGEECSKAFWLARLARGDSQEYEQQNAIADLIDAADVDSQTALEFVGKEILKFPSTIERLTNITRIDLSNNMLTFLPSEISVLEKLKEVVLSGNAFVDIPSILFYIPALELIDMSRNSISGIPAEICCVSTLKSLQLSFNGIINVPVEIARLRNLESLQLDSNLIHSLPPELCLLESLSDLSLSGNGFKVVPEVLQGFKTLKNVDLKGNEIAAYGCEPSKLESITSLSLEENPISSGGKEGKAPVEKSDKEFVVPEMPPEVLLPKWPVPYIGPITPEEENALEMDWMNKMGDEKLEDMILDPEEKK